jgi:hypothetical protein
MQKAKKYTYPHRNGKAEPDADNADMDGLLVNQDLAAL